MSCASSAMGTRFKNESFAACKMERICKKNIQFDCCSYQGAASVTDILLNALLAWSCVRQRKFLMGGSGAQQHARLISATCGAVRARHLLARCRRRHYPCQRGLQQPHRRGGRRDDRETGGGLHCRVGSGSVEGGIVSRHFGKSAAIAGHHSHDRRQQRRGRSPCAAPRTKR
jgi:hypothetical protein